MKILKKADEIISAISEAKLQSPNKLTSLKYNDNVMFECGCGKEHAVDTAPVGASCRGRSIAHSGVGKGFIL